MKYRRLWHIPKIPYHASKCRSPIICSVLPMYNYKTTKLDHGYKELKLNIPPEVLIQKEKSSDEDAESESDSESNRSLNSTQSGMKSRRTLQK